MPRHESHLWEWYSFHIATLNAWNLYLETHIHILKIATSQQEKKNEMIQTNFKLLAEEILHLTQNLGKLLCKSSITYFLCCAGSASEKIQPSLNIIKLS